MRVLFLAGTEGNTGPANANRAFFEHWPKEDEVRRVEGTGKMARLCSLVKGLLWCDVAITSGGGLTWDVARRVASCRGVPVVGYCHGYLPFENEINQQGISAKDVTAFVGWLDSVDLVATNSSHQAEFIAERQPSVEGKIAVARLGVDAFECGGGRPPALGRHAVVAVSGGTRPIKGNDVVARAVGRLRAHGVDVELRVYGRRYAANPELDALVGSCGRYMEQVDRAEFLRQLREADVFVMDSRHESFGLSALDALEAGCSLLLSDNCGVKEVFNLGPGDVVHDCESVREVAEKIEGLLGIPNARRLYDSLDFDRSSWDCAAERLRQACAGIVDRKRGRQ